MIQQVQAAHIPEIADLKKAVWPHEAADPDLISAALNTPSHQAFIAKIDGQPAGFVSCFVTSSHEGDARWEIDLIAVHPDFRRRGVANQLLVIAMFARHVTETNRSRALIAVDNIGSQKSFTRRGYETDGITNTLYISTASTLIESSPPVDAHLVEVNTFNYRGIWLEGGLSREAFSAAQTVRQQKNLDLVGALIPKDDKEAIELATTQNYEPIGDFQWWENKFEID